MVILVRNTEKAKGMLDGPPRSVWAWRAMAASMVLLTSATSWPVTLCCSAWRAAGSGGGGGNKRISAPPFPPAVAHGLL